MGLTFENSVAQHGAPGHGYCARQNRCNNFFIYFYFFAFVLFSLSLHMCVIGTNIISSFFGLFVRLHVTLSESL